MSDPSPSRVFVASLFLPETINFSLPNNAVHVASPQTRAVVPPAKGNGIPSLFKVAAPPRPENPAIDKGAMDFFKQRAEDLKPAAHVKADNFLLPTTVMNESHTPVWGSGRTLIQPQSRANSPPPKSLLSDNKVQDKAEKLGRAGIRQPQLGGRSESHDRVFSEAPWTIQNQPQGNGGLKNAVKAAVRSGQLEEPIWVGTIGFATDSLEDTPRKDDILDKLNDEYHCLTVICKDIDFSGHYSHFCKQILWPVFHYQLPDNPKSKAYEDHSWIYYVAVNQAFADAIVRDYKKGDVIWVHDYHLLLLPQMLRAKLPDAKIGFFLHVPFPSSEIFKCLAVRKELLEGMLGANLIGFQVPEYARHFLSTCSRVLATEATATGIQLEDRFVDVFDLAIGIDPVALSEHRDSVAAATWLDALQDRFKGNGKKVIVARDKVDQTKGVRPKLLAYELFLNQHPEWREKVTLIQVALPREEKSDLDNTISDIVTRINSTFGRLDHTPVLYLKQDMDYAQYLAMLSIADMFIITSQREGMNLTCHEYVFCQDGKFADNNKHGSLILSEFTGSASVFKKNELSVNPWDFQQVANSIHQALEMSDTEKEDRWKALYKCVMQQTGDFWFTALLEKLEQAYEQQQRRDTSSVPRMSQQAVLEQYTTSENRLFLLDYEGTLASNMNSNNIVLASPQRTMSVLKDLTEDERNTVYVMSGRTPTELSQLFSGLPALGLIAENGCFIKHSGTAEWTDVADKEATEHWKESVEGIMKYYQERTPGSWIEQRNCSIIFHYKLADDSETAARQATDCAAHINDACEEQRVHAILFEGSVIVEPMDLNKGTAADTVYTSLKETTDIDFMMVAGDGREDECIFRWANDLARNKVIKHVTTVSLGARNTEAASTLTQGVTGVLAALRKLASASA